MSRSHQWQCSLCKRKKATREAVADHIRAYHKKPAEPVKVTPLPPAEVEDDESFADRAIDAELDRAMGIHNPDQDWLLP